MHQRRSLVWLGYFIIWLLLGGLAIGVAWQAHITTLYLGALLIEHPTWRPLGWSSSTLVGISKLSILIWASLCFIFIMYLENRLRESTYEHQLLKRGLRYLLWLLILFAICYLITRF